MNTKRRTAHKNPRRTSHRTPPDWARQIFVAARSAAKPSVQEDSERLDQEMWVLTNLVRRALDTGTDKYVLRALEDLEEAHLEDAARMVAFCANDATSTFPVMMKTTGNGKAIAGEVTLFLVPVVLVMDGGYTVPLSLPDGPVKGSQSLLDQCVTSLRRHGRVGPGPTVVAMPDLFKYTDLPMTWSGQLGVLRQCMAAISGQPARLPRIQPKEAENRPTMVLRFLLFAVVSTWDDPDVGPLLEAEEDGEEISPSTDPRWLAWQEELGQAFTNGLPGVLSARVGIPDSWDEAIHDGIDMHNIAGLVAAVMPREKQGALAATQIAMGLCQTDGGMDIRIGITRDGRFLNGFIWTCHRSPEEDLKEAIETMKSLGIPAQQIHVVDDVLGDERCSDCGKPLFPSVDGESQHEPQDRATWSGPGYSRLH